MQSKYNHASFPGKPVQQGDAREAALADGLRRLFSAHGLSLREPLHIDTNGEFTLVLQDGCYGKDLVELLNRHSPRTGQRPTKYMDERNSWSRMNHFDVQEMLEDHEGLAAS